MTWKQLVKLAKKEYGLKRIIWIRNKNFVWGGTCEYDTGIISLNHKTLNGSKNFGRKVRTLFHELGHIHCYENNIWCSYHHSTSLKSLTKYEKGLVIKTGLKAERWVDNWAAKEMKKYYPKIKYKFVYMDKEKVKKYFHEGYLKQYYR